jgi:hypothetical protein
MLHVPKARGNFRVNSTRLCCPRSPTYTLTDSHISNRFHARGLLIALMIEAARTSETLVNFYQTARRYNPEDSHLRTHRRENLKSHLYSVYSMLGPAAHLAKAQTGSLRRITNSMEQSPS